MPVLAGVALLAAIAWVYLLAGHGGFWRTDQRLPAGGPALAAGALARRGGRGAGPGRGGHPAAHPAQPAGPGLPGRVRGAAGGRRQHRRHRRGGRRARAPPRARPGCAPLCGWCRPGRRRWAGRARCTRWPPGCAAAGECDYVLFTDADIGYAPGTLTALVRAAVAGDRALVSQMALLRADTGWERLDRPGLRLLLRPAVPVPLGQPAGSRTAAAAGGCMLVHRATLAAAGGLAPISGARIDDVALGRLLKRPPSGPAAGWGSPPRCAAACRTHGWPGCGT